MCIISEMALMGFIRCQRLVVALHVTADKLLDDAGDDPGPLMCGAATRGSCRAEGRSRI